MLFRSRGDHQGGCGQEFRPVFCGADEHAVRGLHGRRAHLRLRGGPAGGADQRFHDRGVSGASLGGAGQGDKPDCE